MRFIIDATWNNKPVLSGACTAVMAHAVMVYMTQNWGRSDLPAIPTLDRIVNMDQGDEAVWTFADNTGSAAVTIRCVSM